MRDYAPIMRGILSAASSALTLEDRPVTRVELTPGNLPAWDDCCAGQLFLRVIEVFPTMGTTPGGGTGVAFPQIDTAQRGAAGGRCAIHMLAVHVAIGVMRCAHTVMDSGIPPTPSEVSEDGELMLADMATLLDVIVCDLDQIRGVHRVKVGKWSPLGVNGGCHGGEWDAYLAVDPCTCKNRPEPEPEPEV